LENVLDPDEWLFFEGADELKKLTNGDLEQFKQLAESAKAEKRGQAISEIQKQCVAAGKSGIVAGHYMFPSTPTNEPSVVWTEQDSQTFTHIIYLEGDPETVLHRRRDDISRSRPEISLEELRVWQESEKSELRRTCYANGIYFVAVNPEKIQMTSAYLQTLLLRFQDYDEDDNLTRMVDRLHNIMRFRQTPARTMLVFDADRTLSASDTGQKIWEGHSGFNDSSPLNQIFASRLLYSYKAFCQAELLYLENFGVSLDKICDHVASHVTLYPEMLQLLRRASTTQHSGAIVVTCSPQVVWEKILNRHGLSHVPVIGGGPNAYRMVVDYEIKGGRRRIPTR
jgi:adenylate kinase